MTSLWQPLHYAHTVYITYLHTRVQAADCRVQWCSVGFFEGSEGLSLGKKNVWFEKGLDREELVLGWRKPLIAVTQYAQTCLVVFQLLLFFLLTLYLRSVCLLTCFHCICKIWVREVKAGVPLEQRFSYHIRDWKNVSTGLTFLFWWRWYYFS